MVRKELDYVEVWNNFADLGRVVNDSVDLRNKG